VPEPQKDRGSVRDRVLVVNEAEVGGGVVWWLGATGQIVEVHGEGLVPYAGLAWRKGGEERTEGARLRAEKLR
jgi:hypothetical protein